MPWRGHLADYEYVANACHVLGRRLNVASEEVFNIADQMKFESVRSSVTLRTNPLQGCLLQSNIVEDCDMHRVPLNELRWMNPSGSVHWVKSGPVVAVVRLSEVRSHFA